MFKSNLAPALDGKRIEVPGPGPTLCAYASPLAHNGRSRSLAPLLLVHSVNASASAAEVQPLFERYTWQRPVLALELPGFGSSQRGPLSYTPQTMVESILRAVKHLLTLGLTQPADILGMSLSCEFVALAALEQPQSFRSVAMVSPTGLETRRDERFDNGRSKDRPLVRRLLSSAAGEPLFRLLTTRSSMRWFFERAWGSPVIDEPLLAYGHLSARQPGARHAPAAFIAGALFTQGIAERYAQLAPPVWIAHGVRGEFADVGGLARIEAPRGWSVDAFGTGAMPHFEATLLFVARYDAFLRQIDQSMADVGDSTQREPAARAAVGN